MDTLHYLFLALALFWMVAFIWMSQEYRKQLKNMKDSYLRALAQLDDIATTIDDFAHQDHRTMDSLFAEIPPTYRAKLRGFEVQRNDSLVTQSNLLLQKLANYRIWADDLREKVSS